MQTGGNEPLGLTSKRKPLEVSLILSCDDELVTCENVL